NRCASVTIVQSARPGNEGPLEGSPREKSQGKARDSRRESRHDLGSRCERRGFAEDEPMRQAENREMAEVDAIGHDPELAQPAAPGEPCYGSPALRDGENQNRAIERGKNRKQVRAALEAVVAKQGEREQDGED